MPTLEAATMYHPLGELLLHKRKKPDEITKQQWKTWVFGRVATWTDEDISITIPVNFMTDFASIPRGFRWWATGISLDLAKGGFKMKCSTGMR